MGFRSRRSGIACVSVLIGFIWAGQFVVSIPLSAITRGVRRSWPIVDYPMYHAAHSSEEEIPRLAVVGIRDNSEEIDVIPEDIGGGYWYYQVFANAVIRGQKQVIQDIVRMYEARHKFHLVALRVEDRPLLWKNGSAERVQTKVLRGYPLDSVPPNETVP